MMECWKHQYPELPRSGSDYKATCLARSAKAASFFNMQVVVDVGPDVDSEEAEESMRRARDNVGPRIPHGGGSRAPEVEFGVS